MVSTLCFFQGIGSIVCPRAGAEPIGQLFIEHGDNITHGLRSVNAILNVLKKDSCVSLRNGTAIEIIRDLLQSRTNTRQFGADDSDNLAGDQRYDWCAGYALYRYTLEVNGVKEVQIPE